tara:strand:- start:213 stop:467 length:255 start_codon:yes stop_codon:yes gene_type:complete
MSEKLDLLNIIEVERIRNLIDQHNPELISIFELIVNMGNDRLNDDKELQKKFISTKDDDGDDIQVVLETDSDDDEQGSSVGCIS